jgi:thiamine pyrophosphokinase
MEENMTGKPTTESRPPPSALPRQRLTRGIAFIGGAGPSPEKCGQLAAGADLIVAADSGLIAAEKAGVKPDWILGDMDSLDDLKRLETYPPQRIIRYPQDKDYTDTELALALLWEKGCEETWLIGGGGGRTDHLFAIRSLFERKHPPHRWFTGGEAIYCLRDTQELTLTASPGALVSLFPLGDGPWNAVSRGLKWPLDGLSWNRGFFGVSNVALEGVFSIVSKGGRFLVMVLCGP